MQQYLAGAIAVSTLEIARIARMGWAISADDLQAWGRENAIPLGHDLWTAWAEKRAVELLDELRAAGYEIVRAPYHAYRLRAQEDCCCAEHIGGLPSLEGCSGCPIHAGD